MSDPTTILRGLEHWAKHADNPAVRTDCAAARELIASLLPKPRTVACPHWEPGAITMRTGCTGCEADERDRSSADSGTGGDRG